MFPFFSILVPKVGKKKEAFRLQSSFYVVRCHFNELAVAGDLGKLKEDFDKVFNPKVLTLLGYSKDTAIQQPDEINSAEHAFLSDLEKKEFLDTYIVPAGISKGDLTNCQAFQGRRRAALIRTARQRLANKDCEVTEVTKRYASINSFSSLCRSSRLTAEPS